MTRKIFNSIIQTSAISIILTLIFSELLDSDNIIVKIGIFFIVLLISMMVGLKMSKKITRPLIEVNPDNPKIEYSEINPLINKIHIQKEKIYHQKNQVNNSKQQLSLITENMNEGIVIVDIRNNILFCNSGAMKLLNMENIIIGQSIYRINNSESFRHCIQNAMGGRNSSCILNTPDGDREIIASPSNTMDTINGIVIFIFDATEKQQLEILRREFTSNVSHELKTPLTTIYGIADMLANGIVKPDDIESFSKNICSEAERLIILINDIVSLSKLDEDSVSCDEDETDLYDLTKEIFDRLHHSAAKKNITMKITGEHINIVGNKTILDEIIYNLCDNAIKYNKDHGNIEVSISYSSNKILLIVTDTGMGIPLEHIPRIFERFYCVDKSHSRQINGTGLGLSIVKHGVIYHNGTIRVESIPEQGTSFIIEFPVKKK